ncbi:MAG: Conjugal transfer protein TrbL [Actinomycetia bacterium]|nr:Conjugal transfer protein TrbL [Actinomycetes bacterium]
MGTASGAYKFVLLLHVLAVIAGIGTMVLNGVYAAKARAMGPAGGGAVMQANFDVGKVAEKIIYTIPIFGLALVGMSDKVFTMGQTWVWLSLVLYIVAIGISHGVMIPNAKKMLAGPSGPAEAEALGKKLAAGGMTLNLLVVALVALMIWKPGL